MVSRAAMKHARILEFLSIIQQYGFLNTPLVFEKWKSTWEMPSNGRWALPRGRMREGGERHGMPQSLMKAASSSLVGFL